MPIVISLVATLVVLSSLYILISWRKRSKTKAPSTTIMQGHPLISYSQLVKATDDFSPTNFLGSGSFGSVYKGEFDGQDGECKDLVAVKVLKLQTPGALRSFMAECEALRNMRHRNLVKIVTAQVAGGAGFSTSPQTRPAKLLFVAYTAQRQNFGGPTLNSLLKPADTEQTRKNPHSFFFFLIGRSRKTWRSPPPP